MINEYKLRIIGNAFNIIKKKRINVDWFRNLERYDSINTYENYIEMINHRINKGDYDDISKDEFNTLKEAFDYEE